ncbi:hypothetical protein KQI88_10315 [Alkaliphilus sp. MSJ-5]|uniref:Uncharacterized protein n=1 Tax=Alkaliphilus flagellatus TaxID=2841507 RepID=A0ABS6G2V7_9FIRM|nr:hypothetical protein [Alkaliphilus flagellatus]MBU5676812.1 hypothetical protein [Alkaliphilus flagellatus]
MEGGNNLSIYQVDRVQYIKSQDKLMIFEFLMVDDIKEFIKNFKNEGNRFSENYIDYNYYNKLKALYDTSNINDTCLLIIIYDKFLKKIFYVECTGSFKIVITDFETFQQKFIEINNKDGEEKKSKILGSIRGENIDTFVLDTLKQINCCIDENDDNGLELTKKLLGEYTTKGFDFDLFQHIKSTGETIIYEFLKNETSYVTNYTAHPMRYCWTGKPKDNRQKFIGLWTVKEKLNGRLFLINYSDCIEDGIGISEILDLDVEKGIKEEYKYNLTYEEFINWMTQMKDYKSSDKDYLKQLNHKRKYFDESFFYDWSMNKSRYR